MDTVIHRRGSRTHYKSFDGDGGSFADIEFEGDLETANEPRSKFVPAAPMRAVNRVTKQVASIRGVLRRAHLVFSFLFLLRNG